MENVMDYLTKNEESQAMLQLVLDCQNELLKSPEIQAKMVKIGKSEGIEAAKKWITLLAIATLYGK